MLGENVASQALMQKRHGMEYALLTVGVWETFDTLGALCCNWMHYLLVPNWYHKILKWMKGTKMNGKEQK